MIYHKFIIGQSPWIEMATEQWLASHKNLDIEPIEIDLNKEYKFDLQKILNLNPENSTAFVAWVQIFLIFSA